MNRPQFLANGVLVLVAIAVFCWALVEWKRWLEEQLAIYRETKELRAQNKVLKAHAKEREELAEWLRKMSS